MGKLSFKRIEQILETSETILAEQSQKSQSFQDHLKRFEEKSIECAKKYIKIFYKELDELFNPKHKFETFSETLESLRSAFSEFKKDFQKAEAKDKVVGLLRVVTKLPSLYGNLFEDCFHRTREYCEAWDFYMQEYLSYKQKSDMIEMGSFPHYSKREEYRDKGTTLLQCNEFGRFIDAASLTNQKASKFALDEFLKMEQFSEELSKIKGFDQDTSALLEYIDSINRDGERTRTILHVKDQLVFEKVTTKDKGTRHKDLGY